MNVAGILKEKGSEVATVSAGDPLIDVAQTLATKRIGALVVTGEDGGIAGILSERDVVRAISRQGAKALHSTVGDFMTSSVVTCTPEDSVSSLMTTMTENRFRHLPVVEDGQLAGIISIGDVVKWRIAEAEFEAEEMKRYISSV
ncbi:MAG: CBS domain-containing protein [Hyphomicrobiales bacterium]